MKQTTFVKVLVVVVLIAMGLAVLIPNLIRTRMVSARNACVANLAMIQEAKKAWADRNPQATHGIPTAEDIFGSDFSKRLPMCPGGGTYDFGKANEAARCSLGPPDHVLNAQQ